MKNTFTQFTKSDNFSVYLKNRKLLTEKSFKCQVCHRSYSKKSDQHQHMKVHDELKCFKCDVCLKVFHSESSLERHYRKHTGEKPFVCQTCDKTFSLKTNLVQHQATHSNHSNEKRSNVQSVTKIFEQKEF